MAHLTPWIVVGLVAIAGGLIAFAQWIAVCFDSIDAMERDR